MLTYKKSIAAVLVLCVLSFVACKKQEFSIGDLVNPTEQKLTATVVGVDVTNPFGNGTGKVDITTSAKNALGYKIDFGDGKSEMVPTGIITHKYTDPGTFEYNVSVNAIGTGGTTSTLTKKIKVFVNFQIPAAILQSITGGTSKIWITDKNVNGHFGVGANDQFFPNYYAATPNSREACAYDDEITFSKDANDNVFMSINNAGTSFSIGAATSFYGFSGGDGCYPINTGGNKKLSFSDASSASTPAQSTRIQFSVPGNGIINFGTGGVVYEILSISDTQIHLRNIGADGNSWYQKLTKK
jgi:hypothetical protein